MQPTTSNRPHRTARIVGGVAALALAIAAVGCDRSNPTTAGPSGGAPSLSAPTDPRTAAEAKAVEAYRGMWAAYQGAARSGSSADPQLGAHTTDAALDVLTGGLKSIRDRGLVLKGEVALSPRVVRADPVTAPTRVEITDCVDDSHALLYKKSGELADDKPGGRRSATVTVIDTGSGVWKVSVFALQAVGTC